MIDCLQLLCSAIHWLRSFSTPIKSCHFSLQEHVGGDKAKLICFNLGYLPYGDKQRMTKPSTTVAALEAALDCLQDSGALSVISYIGHEGAHAISTRQLNPRSGQSVPYHHFHCPNLTLLFAHFSHGLLGRATSLFSAHTSPESELLTVYDVAGSETPLQAGINLATLSYIVVVQIRA